MSEICTASAPSRNRRVMRATAALLTGTVLVGCTAPGSHPGVSRYEPTYLRLTEEHVFAQALRRHYLELATNAFDRGDVVRSDFYSLRALMAAEGKLAQPGDAARHVDIDGEAAAIGQRLSMLLMTGARTGSPDIAARAQAAYDCWLVEMGSDGDPRIAQSCRFNAINAMAQLEGASTGARLVQAGGPVHPQGQTYVIEPGAASQVVTAHGVTIEVITQQSQPSYTVPQTYAVPQAYIAPQTYAPAPASHTTIQHAPRRYVTEAVPQPQTIETVPIMQQQTYVPQVSPIQYVNESGFDTVPVMAADDVAALMRPPMQQTMVAEPTIDLGPVETYPVFDTAPVATMPMVEMAAMPMIEGSAAASALMDASQSMRGDFAVYFGFDSDDVTLEGEDVLIDAVEQIRLSGATRVTLMGFTDSVGDARYNQLLAMRRAQAVRTFLQKALGTSVTFEILPVGEVQAVKNGGDGVKEALNRKVELSLSL